MKRTLLTQALILLILLAGCLPFSASAQTITITGTSVGNDIICLSEGDDFDILLELDGTFPEDVVFTAYAGSVEIGTATGNNITSISITDFAATASGRYDLFIQSDNGVTSNFFEIDIIQNIDPALDYLFAPSTETVTIAPDEPLDLTVYNNEGIGLFYKLVHVETMTSVTDWFIVPDDPAVLTLENVEEGTYRLIARGQGHLTGIICQDSVPLSEPLNSFTVIHETVTSNLKGKTEALHIYPNPATNALTVELSGNTIENVHLLVTDLSGSVLLTQTSANTSGAVNFDLNALPNGMYMLKMVSDTEVSMKPFIKN